MHSGYLLRTYKMPSVASEVSPSTNLLLHTVEDIIIATLAVRSLLQLAQPTAKALRPAVVCCGAVPS